MALVLCIDDDFVVAKMVADIVTFCRHEPIVETDPIEAIATWIHDPRLAVVITDFMLPRMSGVEVLSIVQEARPEVRRVLITAAAKDEVPHRAARDGIAEMLIIKPPAIEDIRRALAWLKP